ncbi:MAG: alpha/beta hydrolase [Burkholderiales bacterium]|nr:MAG: alpha/beta hydrolase [Burkholderiales bacterium]
MDVPSDRRPEIAFALRRPDGATVACRIRPAREPAGLPAVVLLHGLASNLTRFTEFVEHTALDARHELLRIDLRGHGGSLSRRPISQEVWSDDLVALLDARGHAAAVLVGHSLGAQVALHCAARHPARIRGLVLIDPVFRDALLPRWRRLARAGPLLAAAAASVRALNALGMHRRGLPPLDLRALDETARQALASPRAEAEFIRRYSSTRADLRTTATAVYLQDLVEMFRPVPPLSPPLSPSPPPSLEPSLEPPPPLPTLVLQSTAAHFADPRQMRDRLAGPRTTVVEIACNHWPLTERPVEVREAIERWCGARFGEGAADPPGRSA